jgi:signal transduction histidine kinase
MSDVAPSPRGPERWAREHPVVVDVLLAVVATLFTAGTLASVGAFGTATVGAVGLLVSVPVAILLRRLSVYTALVVATAGAVLSVVPGILVLPIGLLVIATFSARRGATQGVVAAAVITVLAAVWSWAAHGSVADAAFSVVVLVVGLLVGAVVRSRRQHVAALVELADRLRLERDQRAAIAVGEERTRIAREMHDVVAHGISVMTRLADGAEAMAERDPAASRVAVRRIGDVGRSSLADMRRVLGVLRDDAVPTEPQPGADGIDGLVAEHVAIGMPVRVVAKPEHWEALPASTRSTVYRIVQECLTNAARYAVEPTVVDVVVRVEGADVCVEVRDDGAATAGRPTLGSERGLVGVRERAAMYGGSVDAGPVEPHGWRVRAVLAGATT